MNIRNPFPVYAPCGALAIFLLFMVGFWVKAFFDFRARGLNTQPLILAGVPVFLLVLAAFTFIFNSYYSQKNSVFDSKGVHWRTLFGSHFIPWSEVIAVNLLHLRGGARGLRVASAKESFKIELDMVGDAGELKDYVEKSSHRKIVETKMLGIQ